jgi:hypothetical protein
MVANAKAILRDEILGRKVKPSVQIILDMKIEALYEKVHEFKFKSLRPWVVMQAGDCINSQQIIATAKKRCENVQYGGRLLNLPNPNLQQNQKQCDHDHGGPEL